MLAAYFEDSFEALYGVVYRPQFEARLAKHFETGGAQDDPSWYALRNIVYATGCRTLLAGKKTVTWAEAQHQSWPFFENALSVHFELLFTPTGLVAVQAIAAMASSGFLFPVLASLTPVPESSPRRSWQSSA